MVKSRPELCRLIFRTRKKYPNSLLRIQRRYDFSHQEKVSLAEFNLEMNVNFFSLVAFTHAFLPLFIKKDSQTGVIFTGAKIAIIPTSALTAYCASKSALNVFTLCLRDQLRDTNVKVVEILPSPVQTELHDVEMGEEVGRKFGMPLDVFKEQTFKELVSGKDQIVIGTAGPAENFNEINDKRRSAFESLAKMMPGES